MRAGVDAARQKISAMTQPLSSARTNGAQAAFTATGGTGLSSSANDNVIGSDDQPEWANKIRRSQTIGHAGTAAAHTLRDGDRGAIAESPKLSEREET